MLGGLSREAQFILSCAATTYAGEFKTDQLNWQSVYRIAEKHGLVPILYRFLKSSDDGIPSEVLDGFHVLATRISARNALLTNELIAILKLFQENSIPVIPYKGPILAHRLYGNIALRDFDDLDLLIQKKDVLAAKTVLQDVGYRPKKGLSGLTFSQERAFLRFHYTYDFILNNPNHQLEVHWGIIPKAFNVRLDYDRIWNRAVTLSWGKRDVLIFCPEDLLLILCISGGKKLWDRLLRVLDVARTLSLYPEINWSEVTARARDARAERMLLLGLSLASTLFESNIPASLKERVDKDPAVRSLTRSIVNRMFSVQNHSGLILQEDQFQPLHMQMREHFTDRVRYCLSLTFTPGVGEWSAMQVPGYLYFLYYFLRPVRLFWKMMKRL